MRTFDQLFDMAAKHKGGADAMEALLPKPQPLDQLAQMTADRWLAHMTMAVFLMSAQSCRRARRCDRNLLPRHNRA